VSLASISHTPSATRVQGAESARNLRVRVLGVAGKRLRARTLKFRRIFATLNPLATKACEISRLGLKCWLYAALFPALLSGCSFYYGFGTFEFSRNHRNQAESLTKEGRYQEAIAEYKLHLEQRLADPRRPADENPYFYYLMIGDMHLKLSDPAGAQTAYETARNEGVETALVSDRFRLLAQWYEERREHEKAIAVLHQFRDLDPLMFDYEIDRIHKTMVREEESGNVR
jgi:tetratricopeptide (TPR) repeat protein